MACESCVMWIQQNPAIGGLVADATVRLLNRENGHLRRLADHYQLCLVFAAGGGLGLIILLGWAGVVAFLRLMGWSDLILERTAASEWQYVWLAVASGVVGVLFWLIPRLQLKRQIKLFWNLLPDLARSGVYVVETCPGLGQSQLRLMTELPSDEWPRWLHRKAGQVPTVSQYLWSLYSL